MRKPMIAGNWKMNKTVAESVALAESIKAGLHQISLKDVDVVVAPPFTSINKVAEFLESSSVGVSSQNLYFENEGAFTGEISPYMIKEAGCRYCILGHSERREIFGETDAEVNKKVKAALKFNLIPIVCVGETLAQREAGAAQKTVETQFIGSFAGLTEAEMNKLVVAYEPVWAIGTGVTASPAQAQEMHAFIRALILKNISQAAADNTRILYGGSVKPDNTHELLSQPDIDGALVGGASLKAESFVQIVDHACSQAVERR